MVILSIHPIRVKSLFFRFPVEPTRNFVKRVVGVPGDTVEITKGIVYLNGKALDEPYISLSDRGTMDPFKVPPDSYFVLGDNRGASDDSRSWGVVPAENIIGRAWVTYWPPVHLGRAVFFPIGWGAGSRPVRPLEGHLKYCHRLAPGL